jgi:hypothetical protein
VTASREVKSQAVKVGHTPTGLLDEQRACSLIPDRFPILAIYRNTHQQFGRASREQHLLRLAVHEDGRRMTPKFAKYAVQLAEIAVT